MIHTNTIVTLSIKTTLQARVGLERRTFSNTYDSVIFKQRFGESNWALSRDDRLSKENEERPKVSCLGRDGNLR